MWAFFVVIRNRTIRRCHDDVTLRAKFGSPILSPAIEKECNLNIEIHVWYKFIYIWQPLRDQTFRRNFNVIIFCSFIEVHIGINIKSNNRTDMMIPSHFSSYLFLSVIGHGLSQWEKMLRMKHLFTLAETLHTVSHKDKIGPLPHTNLYDIYSFCYTVLRKLIHGNYVIWKLETKMYTVCEYPLIFITKRVSALLN